ncbi:mat A-3 [Parachaetomium inaequale]|uniref:Mat A-3 n=1 Tax=Parachaetomium inaequale TaxID=2588326 RepID=A0AAN6P5T9_9PEZI|nr:mat A-3 [Parachaetomium inaequale]
MTSHVTGNISGDMASAPPLAFVFSGNEMIVQFTANNDELAASLMMVGLALENYRNVVDGKHAVIVRSKAEPTQYCITSVPYAQTLNEADYYIIKSTEMEDDATLQRPVTPKVVSRADVIKLGIRRPRNPFIIYRQWMSPKIHASNPSVTAACISQVVAKTWQLEKPEVKAHFKVLADEEDRIHKEMYPGYRYVAARRNPQLPPSKRNLPYDPMTVDERLIAAGF